jgi:hypothetical protein
MNMPLAFLAEGIFRYMRLDIGALDGITPHNPENAQWELLPSAQFLSCVTEGSYDYETDHHYAGLR